LFNLASAGAQIGTTVNFFAPLRKIIWPLLAAGFLAFWTLNRVIPVLPKVLADELTYSMDARKLPPANSQVSNYLFNLLFSTTNLAGQNYYLCAKVINVLMLLGIGVVIFLAAKLFTGTKVSAFIAAMAVLGPVSTYASYFTPDIMFYLGSSLVLYFALKLNPNSSLIRWALLGCGVGVDALIKPHALFLLLPLAAYALYLSRKDSGFQAKVGSLRILLLIGSSFFVKLFIGFEFAGYRGLGLFGSNYDNAASRVFQASAGGIPSPHPVQSASENHIASSWSIFDSHWMLMVAVELMLNVGFILIFFGPPVIKIFSKSWPISKNRPALDAVNRFNFLVGSSLLSLVLISSLYAAISAAWGEVLDFRILVRYYEYALLFLPISLIANFENLEISSSRRRLLLLGLVFGVLAIATPTMQALIPPFFADSGLYASVAKSGLTLYPFAIIGFLSVLTLFLKKSWSPKSWLYIASPLITLVFLASSFVNLTVLSSTKDEYTLGAEWVNKNLSATDIENMQVIGNVKTQVQSAQFWLDNPTVQGTTVDPGATVDTRQFASNTYLLVVDYVKLKGTGYLVHEGKRFFVIRVFH
jgi:phosphoglycerol transferase